MSGLHNGMISPKLRATLILLSFFASESVWACQVPVFRYALERWQPGLYQVSTAEGMKADPPANLELKKAADSSQMELFYPSTLRQATDKPIWSAPTSEANMRLLVDSPIRQELRKRLLAGQSAVWLLIESGDAAKDDAAAKVIEEGLQSAKQKLKLPDGVLTQEAAKDPKKRHENVDVLRSSLPLKIEFSTLRLSRQKAEEVALIAMLMHIEPDLGDFVLEPMVFPIFGRGRALEPIIGKGIHADNILEACTYLCSACSCEIKEQNPGIDLLMAADWSPVGTDEEMPITVKIAPKLNATNWTSGYWIGLSTALLGAALWLISGCIRS